MLLDHFVSLHFWPYCERLRLSTRVGYESAYRCHIRPRFGEVDMDAITVEAVETWLAEMPSSGAAKKAWSVLRAILRKAYKWGHTDNDITHREITQPKHRRREPSVLNIQGVRELLRGFYGHELEPLVIVSVCLGLRRGEACALELSSKTAKPINLIAPFTCHGSRCNAFERSSQPALFAPCLRMPPRDVTRLGASVKGFHTYR